ncbi:MAG: DEAD/DEAH box helicase [Simkaniaceae bacterium]|nr:DEAD/DEAH box helicase [Simkaniaceae bacterium]
MEIKKVFFAEGTYQVEVYDPRKGCEYWPFLQIDDAGHIRDAFCTCEEEGRCAHVVCAHECIIQHGVLHVKFRSSFWNQICQIAARRHGYDVSTLKESEEGFVCESASKKGLFYLHPKGVEGKAWVDETILHRQVETEETSLKFFNLSDEEILLWKKGTPSHQLRYELSIWSDLAKWLFMLQEFERPYTIHFKTGAKGIPVAIIADFEPVEVGFYIALVNWGEIIPSLLSVKTPVSVHEFRDLAIEAIHYDKKKRLFRIIGKQEERKDKGHHGIEMGEWEYYPDQGFFPKTTDPLFERDEIPSKEVKRILKTQSKVLKKYLKNGVIAEGRYPPHYTLAIDSRGDMSIQCYLFEKGDLEKEDSAQFGSWVYIDDVGFFELEETVFDSIRKVIPKARVVDCLLHHRTFLNQFEGFHINLTSVESTLVYRMHPEEGLEVFSQTQLVEGSDGFIDYGDWVYVQGRGFYSKSARQGAFLNGEKVPPDQINLFIESHREELEQVKGFFTEDCPLAKAGLNVSLSRKGTILVEPSFKFKEDRSGIIYESFVYEEGKGFSEIPHRWRIPQRYMQAVEIKPKGEPFFVTQELDQIRPFILKIDQSLIQPRSFHLQVRQVERDGKDWIMKLTYESEIGSEVVGKIKRGLSQDKSYILTKAGLIVLKNPRFNWLRDLPKERINDTQKKVRLTTLEWFKLSLFEEIELPRYKASRNLLEDLDQLLVHEPLDLSRLRSTLRPYQQTGVKWLYFLYHSGLSGLLCDEMGLGKTHQAMALIAAIGQAKILIVCPTSVIYHWEDLLAKFLVDARVVVYYGIKRELTKDYNILLTSYGTLRAEQGVLSTIEFDLAVYDELQNAKNAQSQTHKSLQLIQAKMRLGLTGTPIENNLSELKALFDLILPGYFPPTSLYKELFLNPIEKTGDKGKKELLKKMVKPFLLRRKKKEVLHDLPEKIEEVLHCSLSEEQKQLYKKAFLQKRDELFQEIEKEAGPIPYLHIFAVLNELKKICNHPALISKQSYHKHNSGKWELFVELFHEVRDSGQKMVIFSQYLEMLDIIEMFLVEQNIPYATVRGSTRDRKEPLKRFQEDPQCEVFLGSLKAVGVGVDLTAASVVIHYDRWWNSAREDQATDRVHRIGQKRGVQVFKLVTKHSIEEHIDGLIMKKRGLMDEVIGYDEESAIKTLSRDELKELLSLINQDISTIW